MRLYRDSELQHIKKLLSFGSPVDFWKFDLKFINFPFMINSKKYPIHTLGGFSAQRHGTAWKWKKI